MEAPVKLLAPLFGFIFPMVFVALGYVMLSKAIQGGMLTWPPLVWAYTWPGG
jgi:tight adherence protein C